MKQEFDFNDPEFIKNPHPFYTKLRASKKPLWVLPRPDMRSSNDGIWVFSRYEDCVAILKQSTSISNDLNYRFKGDTIPFYMHMLNHDGKEHARLRRLVNQFFSTQYITNLETHIYNVVENHIESMIKNKDINLITDFAEKIPFDVIASILGIPLSDMPRIRKWTIAIGNGFDTFTVNEEIIQKQQQALLLLLDYLRVLIKNEEETENQTVLYSLIQAQKEGHLNNDELLGMVSFLLIAGHETTIALIGNGLWLLLSHPEQWQLLVENPGMIPQAIEEVLRFESPAQRSSFRIATKTIDINGNIVKPGEQLTVAIASANRDETIFTDPHSFDIQREVNPHIAFGIGVHSCIGQHLARVEARIAFEKIIARFPHMKLKSNIPQWRSSTFFRGLESLCVTL
ncbi:cytochrome P450 [Sulfurovum sp. zt1-1]|uniref:Cytochrome P450 n=1 Tax=Sulfurovum zhangzhouensis TaxID=3019067 RepID=A0ABT7QX87_9BACT|nr:cytochrome P450 [Sulfurovum zhangzhouensis]MDM5271402.1 cytochrome P450 [Sulfurovum zhangzhouensis]